MNQNEPKRSNANRKSTTAIHDQIILTMFTIWQVLTIPLLTEEAFTEAFRR